MLNLDHIRAIIAEGDLKKALDDLLKLLESSDQKTRRLRDGVIILHSKYQDLARKETLGLIEADDALREKGQINDGLLSLITDIEVGTAPTSITGGTAAAHRQRKWLWLLLLIPIGLVAVFWKQIAGKDKKSPEPVLSVQETRVELSIEGWNWSPKPVVKGQAARIHFEVKNSGTADAAGVEVKWWANATEASSTQAWTIDLLKAGEIKAFDFSYTWPGALANAVTSRIRVDPVRKFSSDNPEDNLKEASVELVAPPPVRSDLAIVDYNWQPIQVIKGRPVSIVVNIKNNGPSPASNVRVEWWNNVSGPAPGKIWTLERLNPGEQRQLVHAHTWPDNPGNSVVTQVRIDPTNTVPDNDRRNNMVWKTVTFVPTDRPSSCDLLVSRSLVPHIVQRGQNITITFDVSNRGPSEARNFSVYFYTPVSGTRPAETWEVDRLPAGRPKSFRVQYRVPANASTLVEFKIVLDPARHLLDSDVSNNTKTVTVRIQ